MKVEYRKNFDGFLLRKEIHAVGKSPHEGAAGWTVPRRETVGSVQKCVQRPRPRMPETEALIPLAEARTTRALLRDLFPRRAETSNSSALLLRPSPGESFLEFLANRFPRTTLGHAVLEFGQSLFDDLDMPVWNRNFFGRGCDTMPERLEILDSLLDREVVEPGGRIGDGIRHYELRTCSRRTEESPGPGRSSELGTPARPWSFSFYSNNTGRAMSNKAEQSVIFSLST